MSQSAPHSLNTSACVVNTSARAVNTSARVVNASLTQCTSCKHLVHTQYSVSHSVSTYSGQIYTLLSNPTPHPPSPHRANISFTLCNHLFLSFTHSLFANISLQISLSLIHSFTPSLLHSFTTVCVSLFYVNDIGSTGSRGRTRGIPCVHPSP